LLFAPRWIYALPLVLLVPLAIALRPRWLALLSAMAIIVMVPVADLRFPSLDGSWRDQPHVRVVSCNVREWEHEAAEALAEVIGELEPDIVAIQEHAGRMPEIWGDDWNLRVADGLIIASPHPISERSLSRRLPYHRADALGCTVTTPQGAVRFCNLHLETPRPGLEAILDRRTLVHPGGRQALISLTADRLAQSRQVSRFAREQVQAEIVAGDFNMPVESAIYRQLWRGYRNAFSWVGSGYGYTKWSEKRGLSYGLRIDHVLCSQKFQPVRCWVARDIGSDHLPVVADFVYCED
jgi:endonuclease/exonuclease/phosphatase (EEP) superfamily protein YafD